MNFSRNVGTALLLGLVGALVGLALLATFVLPVGSWINASAANPPAAEPAGDGQGDRGEAAAKQEGPNNQDAGTQEVGEERAGEIAVERLGEGQVTWSGKEDDHGALWEIEVTRPGGAEADVYVAADGRVTHVKEKGGDNEAGADPASEPAPQTAEEPAQPQAIDANGAAEIAASHVGGTADSVSREADGDYGATWDVDVYAPDGEYTIYVSATGEIVRVEGPFKD